MKKMSIWTWLGAVFPILFLFLMMSVFHMKTERATFLGIICAMISAILIGKSTPQIVTMDLEKGAFSALNILIVIWPAVFLYEMMEFAGVFQSIKQMLQKKTQDELIRNLKLGVDRGCFLLPDRYNCIFRFLRKINLHSC